MTVVTVPGAHGGTVALRFDSQANAALARQLAASIVQGVQALSVVPEAQSDGPLPKLPSGKTGEFIQSANGLTVLPKGYDDVVDTAREAVIFGSGGQNEAILAGAGDLTFIATGGSGTIVGGRGDDTIVVPGFDGGGWSINLGGGDDRVLALGKGHDTISAGQGHNQIQLGSGQYIVDSQGDDTVVAGGGAETVAATGHRHSDLVYGGSSNLYFVGGKGNATVLGGSGSDTVFGGGGDELVRGGSGGGNLLYAGNGRATLFGGGDGDTLVAEGGKAQTLNAGPGNETLLGALADGRDTFKVGSGNDLIIPGTGNDTVIAGSGSATVTAGLGTDIFAFIKGEAGGSVLVQNFGMSDKIALIGYGRNEIENALKDQVSANGSLTITLSDNTKIILTGVGSLHRSDFTSG